MKNGTRVIVACGQFMYEPGVIVAGWHDNCKCVRLDNHSTVYVFPEDMLEIDDSKDNNEL